MTNQLALYESARAALAKAVEVDEVKQIHDQSAAMEAAARVYKDKSLEADAREIRMRAKRRLGELINDQKKTVGLSAGTRGSKKKGARVDNKPTLAEAGIDKNLAHAARTEAAKSDQQFEQDVAAEKERITAPAKPKPKLVSKEPKAVLGLTDQCIEKVRKTIENTLQQMQRGQTPKAKFDHLFAALRDLVDDIEGRALARFEQNETVEESAEKRRAEMTKLAEADESSTQTA